MYRRGEALLPEVAASSSSHWKQAHTWLRIFSLVPYTRAFFVVGSLAQNTQTANSDIDIIVRARHGRVWLQRALFVCALALSGRRRTGAERAQRFCTNATIGSSGALNHIARLHPRRVYVPVHRWRLRHTAERLLDATGLGVLCEKLARFLITAYITRSFSRFAEDADAVCILTPHCIAYHPPRAPFVGAESR